MGTSRVSQDEIEWVMAGIAELDENQRLQRLWRAEGRDGVVSAYSYKVTIERTGEIMPNLGSTRDIPLSSIAAVEFRKPRFWRAGHIRFLVPGMSPDDPAALMAFAGKEATGSFLVLRDVIVFAQQERQRYPGTGPVSKDQFSSFIERMAQAVPHFRGDR